jgi:hypothetical protein
VVSPALRLLRVRYPVTELRRTLKASSRGDPVSVPEPAARHLVLYRTRDLALRDETLSEGAFALLSSLAAGMPLVAACEHAMQQVPMEAGLIEQTLGSWFATWAERAFIVDVQMMSNG